MNTKKWIGEDKTDGSQVGPEWNPSPPDSWLSDDAIVNIRAIGQSEQGRARWNRIVDKIENQFEWVDSKQNTFYSNYPLIEDRVKEERYTDADIHITDAEEAGDLTSTEADEFRSILELI